MKYMVVYTIVPGTFQAAVDRFLKTGGLPPAPAKMLGRWHGLGSQGFALGQSKDPAAVYQWVGQWADVLEMQVTAVIEDAAAARALKANRRK
jgi:Protein of unknown function (DUF3303)